MCVRAFEPADLVPLAELQPEGWTDIVPMFKYYLRSAFCRPMKIEKDSILVGVCAAIVFPGTGWLAHVIVRESFRGGGFGRRLIKKALSDMNSMGCGTVSLIATDAGHPLYLRAGFRDQMEYIVYQGSRIPLSAASEGVRPLTFIDIPELERLDRIVSGERRRALIRGSAADASVYEKDGRIKGAYLPALGEGSVIAVNASSGTALLREKIVRDDKVVIPEGNETARRILGGWGFRETSRMIRMVLGPEFAWKPDCLFGRAGGNLG